MSKKVEGRARIRKLGTLERSAGGAASSAHERRVSRGATGASLDAIVPKKRRSGSRIRTEFVYDSSQFTLVDGSCRTRMLAGRKVSYQNRIGHDESPMINDSETAIDCSNLRKVYREGLIFRRRFEALKGISFSVQRGEVFGLLGPNGAGKTTFIKILLGIIKKTGGEARMLGYPAGSRDGRKLVGYLPENLRIPRHLNANTALEYYGNLSNLSRSEVRSRRDAALEMVGLRERANDSVRKYSKGMLQRLGLAQAMLHQPRLLVLDEPTDGLDPQARADVRTILRRLGEQGTTIFLNSHILQEVEMVCDRVAILDRGNLSYCGSVSEIETYVKQQRVGQTADASSRPGPQFEVTFELSGDEGALKKVMASAQVLSQEVLLAGNYECKLGFDDQTAVDQFVDQLRAEGISLIGMNRRHLSLEDAFLEILAGKRES